MEFDLFGYSIAIGKKEEKPKSPPADLSAQGAKAKREQSWEKIRTGLDQIHTKQLKYSEYRLQQVSGVSINTIKKYRDRIEGYRRENQKGLF